MASVDFAGDIERIIEILSKNTILKESMRDFVFGEEDEMVYDRGSYIVVTVPNRPFLTQDRFGMGENSTDSQHTIQYSIKIIANHSKDAQDVEREIFSYIKQVTDTLKANPRLKHPDTDDDPRCTRSFVFDIPFDADKRGNTPLVATIGLQCQIGSQSTISIDTIPELLDIPIIDRPNETHIDNVENLYNTARERKGVATINETHTFFAKIEYTKIVWEKLHELQLQRKSISFSLKRNTDIQTRNGRLTNISNGAGYDTIETILVQIEIF